MQMVTLPAADEVDFSSYPVLSVLGVAGHVAVTEALYERFGQPVELVINSGLGTDYLSGIKPEAVGRVHSLPEYLMEHWESCITFSDQRIIEESRQIENRIGLASVNPYHYFDRVLRESGDWSVAIRRHLMHLRFVEELLVDRKFLFIRGENVTQVGCIIQQVAKGLGHRLLRPLNARIAGRLEMEGYVPGELLGWEQVYQSFKAGRDRGMEDAAKEGMEWLDQFRSKPERPRYTIQYARNRTNPWKRFRNYTSLATGAISRLFRQDRRMRKFDRQSKSTRFPGLNFLQHVLWADIRGLIQSRRKLFQRELDTSSDYIYFPLHYSPELSTLVYGYRHEEQVNLIRAIAAYLPTGYRLVVKEHTAMIGRRPYSFYKTLDSFYNVDIVNPATSTFEITKDAQAVATITGTAGFEAFAMGKRVIACGEVFYRQFPGVLGLEIDPSMGSRLKEFLAKPPPDDETIRTCFKAYFVCTYKSTMVDVGEDTDFDDASAQAYNFALACESSLKFLDADSRCLQVQ